MTESDLAEATERTEWDGAASRVTPDLIAREEPLEIRIAGFAIAVVMRSPGNDEELVTGFLLTEGIALHPRDLHSVRESTIAERPEAEGNVVEVVPAPHLTLDLGRLRRNLYASSSCGVCGKASLDHVLTARPARPPPALRLRASVLYDLPERLRTQQTGFGATGGLHAAALFDATGTLVCSREDIGRHNAVDKVIGWAARAGLDLAAHLLLVSGRVSFEIAQKAAMVGLPAIAAVSAPSSLAVALCREAGMVLVAFLRGKHLSVYAGANLLDP